MSRWDFVLALTFSDLSVIITLLIHLDYGSLPLLRMIFSFL